MLNLKILMMVSLVIFTFATFVNAYLIYRFANNKTLQYFLGFNVTFLLGLSLMIQRGSISDLYAIIIGNTFLASGYIFLYIATKGLLKHSLQWHHRYFIPIFIIFTGMTFFTYVVYDTEMRIILFSLFCAIYGSALGWFFLRHGNGKYFILFRLGAFLSFLSTAMFLLRAFTASTTEIPVSYFQLLVFPYIYLMVIAALLNILFPLQVLHNMQREEKLDLKRGES